jgi:hypothetical protein
VTGRYCKKSVENVPDSDQEHLAHSHNGFLAATPGFNSAVTFSELQTFLE